MQEQDFQNLLRLVKAVGGKFVIVEDGKPRAVLMSYDEFQELAVPALSQKLANQMSRIENVNQEITRAQLDDLREEVLEPDADFWLNQAEKPQDEITIEPIDRF